MGGISCSWDFSTVHLKKSAMTETNGPGLIDKAESKTANKLLPQPPAVEAGI